jgi:uncharacterized membrane protein
MEFWIFLLAVWIFAEWMLRRRDREKNDERFRNVINTLNRAEKDFQELKRLSARVAELETIVAAHPAGDQPVRPASATQPTAPPVVAHVVAPPASTKEGASQPPARETAPQVPPAADLKPPVPTVPPARPAIPAAPPPPSRPAQAPADSTPSPRPIPPRPGSASPVLAASSATHAVAGPKPKSRDIEQALGANWLNKIGIAVLVIGIALFLAYKFPTLSNPEKVGLGYLVSFSILGLGVFLERQDLYRVFARALIGGGWALVFFTTYAMHFVQYTRVIDTEWVDLVILFAVAWAMVIHTLHYNSQVVTGLSFLLGFTTVAISQNTVYCLTAGAILALGLVAIVHKRRWFELEIFGLIASYLNHYVWLRSVIEPMGAQKHMFPEFLPSAVLLLTYWALYRWSYIARRVEREAQEHISTLAALLNTTFLLFLLKYQSVRPDLAFYALLALGAIELALGQLPVTRKRRTAMVILSTIGIVLLVAAIPFKYSGMGMAILWLAQAQALVLAGVFTRETLFRRFGFLTALLTVGEMLLLGAAPVFLSRSDRFYFLHDPPEYKLAVTFLFAALIFYADAEWVPRKWKHSAESDFEEICFRAVSYLGLLTLFVGLWLAFPNLWTSVAWSTAAIVLAVIGRVANAQDLSYESHGLAIASFLGALAVNLDAGFRVRLADRVFQLLAGGAGLQARDAIGRHFTDAFFTTALVIGLLYLCAYFSGPAGTNIARVCSAIDTWAAMILLVGLTLQELSFPWISVTWAVLGLLLMIAALQLKRSHFAAQAVLVSGFSMTAALVVNLGANQPFSLIPSLSARLVTIAITATLFYLTATWARDLDDVAARLVAGGYTWAASFLVWSLLLYELHSLQVALGWAIFGLALFEAGVYFESLNLRVQAYCAFASGLVRIFLINVGASRHDMVITTLPLAIIFYYVHWRLETRQGESLAPDRRMLAGPFLSYFGTATVATVLYFGLDAGWVATGWAALAFLLIGASWAAKHNVLLHHSLLLALAVAFRTIFSDLSQPFVEGAAFLDSRSIHVIAASALLFAAMVFAFPLRRRFAAQADRRGIPEAILPFIERPEQVFFFVPLVQVTALIVRDVSEGRVTMAWGIEAVIVFLFALVVGERSFRLTGLGLLLLCVGKILVLDVWRQDKADRFTTFIILGIALLLVSFLYTRYSETIRRYL